MEEQSRFTGVHLSKLRTFGFDLDSRFFADSLLEGNFQTQIRDIVDLLLDFRINVEELVRGGGGESSQTQRLKQRLVSLDWHEHEFYLTKSVKLLREGRQVFERLTESETHEVDHVKIIDQNILGLEIEWNNKDPFFNRDLQTYGQLHDDGVLTAGIIITRGARLQSSLRDIITAFARKNRISTIEDLKQYDYRPTDQQRNTIQKALGAGKPFPEAWAGQFTSSKYGASTTHWRKLIDRLEQGFGGRCPILSIGLPREIIVE